jgi:hypothetical protein
MLKLGTISRCPSPKSYPELAVSALFGHSDLPERTAQNNLRPLKTALRCSVPFSRVGARLLRSQPPLNQVDMAPKHHCQILENRAQLLDAPGMTISNQKPWTQSLRQMVREISERFTDPTKAARWPHDCVRSSALDLLKVGVHTTKIKNHTRRLRHL